MPAKKTRPKLISIEDAALRLAMPATAIRQLVEWRKITDRLSCRVTLEEIQAAEVTISEAAHLLGFKTTARIYQYIDAGELSPVNPGEHVMRVLLGDVAEVAAKYAKPRRGNWP